MATFGVILKEWRALRRMSQLDLGLGAEVSARHISFLETGRSRPSRDMVLRLAEALHMPLSARNQLLAAVGLVAAHGVKGLSEAERAPLQQAVDWILQNHSPYPGMALDRHWRLVACNSPARIMLQASGVHSGDSLIEALLGNELLRHSLVNLEEVEALSLLRLRTELAHFGRDPLLESAVERLQMNIAGHKTASLQKLPAIIPAVYRINGQELSLFSTLSQFASTGDIAMSELKVEMMFPADERTKEALLSLFVTA
ncbi:transcriptional regulator, y4mF family [Phaeobacter sp. CECT 5382]|uniref:helix-turn-helix domain-containing protein n=1 Tax=Phaeobacter sp. CECT 5382 TaxID=1712645 RepID=UPI0006DAA6B9|nr:helix-turn-helix domain-containing protein [Phaeobacter sp. CECT 5382]CUH87481.1 transcriptional regulator, y4mF family [Phaeobacter sp. CECT 5382]